jgi:hypothetical protein
MVEKIISGGQTGADRAGLDVALELGLNIGGWVPRGRRAEDGIVPAKYGGMVETQTDAYEERTKLNVRDSDATVIFTFGPPRGGSALCAETARSTGKPVLLLDLNGNNPEEMISHLRDWLGKVSPRILNVAGRFTGHRGTDRGGSARRSRLNEDRNRRGRQPRISALECRGQAGYFPIILIRDGESIDRLFFFKIVLPCVKPLKSSSSGPGRGAWPSAICSPGRVSGIRFWNEGASVSPGVRRDGIPFVSTPRTGTTVLSGWISDRMIPMDSAQPPG